MNHLEVCNMDIWLMDLEGNINEELILSRKNAMIPHHQLSDKVFHKGQHPDYPITEARTCPGCEKPTAIQPENKYCHCCLFGYR